MSKKKRTVFEDAFEMVLTNLNIDIPMSTAELAAHAGLSWSVVNKALQILMDVQDFFNANRIVVLQGSRSKIILLELRVDLIRLPTNVREWFIEEKFFKGAEKQHYDTEEVMALLGTDVRRGPRTRFEDALLLMLKALELEDEVSVRELSKRLGVTRRTVDRVIQFILRFQDEISEIHVRNLNGQIVVRKRPDIYSLDESRMILLLGKMYGISQKGLSEDAERTLFQIA